MPQVCNGSITFTDMAVSCLAYTGATMILVAFRHGLGVSELCTLTWDQIDFSHGLVHVRRLKNGIPSVHQLGGEEMRSLRALKREDGASRYVFMTDRGAPMTAARVSACEDGLRTGTWR